jgi:hypothetical protein
MSIRRRIPREEDDAAVWRIDVPIMTNCGAAALPMDLRENEHRLLLFEHADELTRSCLIPRAATSCDFLSAVMSLANVRWDTGDLEAIRSIADEVGCNVRR